MVRFKNRHLLVEFLTPSNLQVFPSTPVYLDEDALDGEEYGDEEFDGDDEEQAFNFAGQGGGTRDKHIANNKAAELPFTLPLPDATGTPLTDEGGSAVFKAVRGVVQGVFGDEGWGRVASSFRVIYHSPLTTLTILRISRQHYRLLWAAVTLLTNLGGVPVLPRVLCVSGTIKKLQGAAIVYHRQVTARAVAALVAQDNAAERERLQAKWEQEREELARVQD